MINQNTLVSIVVPVYNGEETIRKCIKSIMDQTYTNVEIIIVNDGSNDDSESIIKELMQQDNRIRYYYKDNSGVSSARNLGINNTNGEYLVFVDADDWIDSKYIEYNLNLALTHDSDLVINDFFSNNKSIEKPCKSLHDKRGEVSIKKIKKKLVLTDSFNAPWQALYRLSIIKNNSIRFDECLSTGEDNVFNMAFVDHIKNAFYSGLPFYHYYIQEGSGCRHLHGRQLEMYDYQNKAKQSYMKKWKCFDRSDLRFYSSLIVSHLSSFSMLAYNDYKYSDYKNWMDSLYDSYSYRFVSKYQFRLSAIPSSFKIVSLLIKYRISCLTYIYWALYKLLF